MPTLGERLDLILAYGVEGNETIEELAGNLERSSEASQELINREKDIQVESRKTGRSFKDISKLLDSRRARQYGLNRAMEQAEETLERNAIRFENLRLEYIDGNISSDEYALGLQDLRSEIERLDVPSKRVITTLQRLSQEQERASQSSQIAAHDVRQNSFAFRNLFSIVSTLPNGISSFANSLPMLASQLSYMNARTRESGGLFQSMLQFLKSPAGMTVAIAALIPLVVKLAEHFDILNSTFADAEDIRKEYSNFITELFDQFQEFGEPSVGEIESIRNTIQEIDKLIEEVTDNRRLDMGFTKKFGTWIGTLFPEDWKITQASKAMMTTMAAEEGQLEALQNLREEYIARMIALQLREESAVTDSVALRNKWNEAVKESEEMMEEFDENFRDFEIEEMVVTDETTQQALDDQMKRTQERWQQVGSARLAFEQQLQNTRLQLAISQADQMEAITLREEAQKQQIRDNELISARQRQEMLTLIEKQAAQERQALVQQEELMKRAERQRTTDAAFQLLNSLNGFGEVIHGQSEERARKAFEVNKALQLATAIAAGARAVVEALPNIPLASIVGAMSAVNIAKIASTKFQSSATTDGGRTGSRNATFRGEFQGFNADAQQMPSQNELNFPTTIKLKDRAGKFLTNLEFERERSGGDPRLVQ